MADLAMVVEEVVVPQGVVGEAMEGLLVGVHPIQEGVGGGGAPAVGAVEETLEEAV